MGGKIRASMTVIIEKDQNTTDVFELRVYNDTKKEKKYWLPLEDDRKTNYYFENGNKRKTTHLPCFSL